MIQMDAHVSYLNDINKIKPPILDREKEKDLARRAKKGNQQARKELIESNLRFVISFAKRYSGGNKALKQDLIQEGNIGLLEAVSGFDPEMGYRFNTYARWWVRSMILGYLSRQTRTISTSSYTMRIINKVFKVAREGCFYEDERAFYEDVLEEVNKNSRYRGRYSVDDLMGIMSEYEKSLSVSLDAPLHDDGSSLLVECTEDPKSRSPELLLCEDDDMELLYGRIDQLEEREQKIIKKRFPLNGDKKETLESIGLEFGVSFERIRQLQNNALRKIKLGFIEANEITPTSLQ